MSQGAWLKPNREKALGQYDLDNPAQVCALLVRMAHNKLSGQFRKHARRERACSQVRDGEQRLHAQPGDEVPERDVDNRDLLEAARARLPAEARDLADRRAAGQTWEAIALALGGTAVALRMQHTRALNRIVRELGLAEDDDE